MQFLARRTPKGYVLTIDGCCFGSLFLGRDNQVTGGSFRDDEVNDCFRRLRMNSDGDRSVTACLAMARRAYEVMAAEWAAEAAADAETERRVTDYWDNGGPAREAIQADLEAERHREAFYCDPQAAMYGDASGAGQDWDCNGP